MLPNPIFLGGTGRSGTTLLQKVLDLHKDIFCLPRESRFIIDTNGLIDLVFHLTDGWTPVNADLAIRNFKHLMLVDLNNRFTNPYLGFKFGRYFSEPFYSNLVSEFLTDLAPISYKGRTGLRRGYRQQTIYHPSPQTKEQVLKICAEFVNSLFGHKMRTERKTIWAEKTPHNVLHIGFLISLFPGARFIYIYRDPRDVVASLLHQSWAPSNLEGSIQWLLDVYQRYDQQRSTYPDVLIFELSLEALVEEPIRELDKLSEFLGLEPDFDLSRIDFSKTNTGRWKSEIKPDSHDLIEQRLKTYLRRYKYQ